MYAWPFSSLPGCAPYLHRRQNVDREIRIHSQLSHPNIVRLHTSFEDDDKIYLVMDKQPRDLFETLRERGRLDEEEVVMDVILPLLQALEYLHNQVSRQPLKKALGNFLMLAAM